MTAPLTIRPETVVRPVTLTARQQVDQLVRQTALTSGEPRHRLYARIYERLKAFYGVNISDYPRAKGESLLCVAERYDLLDKLYLIATAERL